jgi:hypothetical protein
MNSRKRIYKSESSGSIISTLVYVAISIATIIGIGFVIKALVKKSQSTQSPQSDQPQQSDQPPQSGTMCNKIEGTYQEDFNNKMLTETNSFRQLFGSQSLTIDPNLAKQAQAYSTFMANKNIWEHGYIGQDNCFHKFSGTSTLQQSPKYIGGTNSFGQNLWQATIKENYIDTSKPVPQWSDETLAKTVVSSPKHSWGSECTTCKEGTESIGGAQTSCKIVNEIPETGHFTQQIWRGTETMGCGKASSKDGTVYVTCNYSPMGNDITPEKPSKNLPSYASIGTACDKLYKTVSQ